MINRILLSTWSLLAVSALAKAEIPNCFDLDFDRGVLAEEARTFSLSEFDKLEVGRERNEVHKSVGPPSYLCGSGIPYDVYLLDDGREVWIAYQGAEIAWGHVLDPGTKERESIFGT